MDVMTKKQRSLVMSRIRSKDTRAEVLLRKTLWHLGFRYRKNYRKLPGTPDIALTRQKIAIFVDGDFWHARGHEERPGEQIASRKKYWRKKLSRNVERDKEVNDALTEEGWLVLRFWESEVRKDLERCVEEVIAYSPRKGVSGSSSKKRSGRAKRNGRTK
ncbi:MAG: very short patch repair endonuclease [Schwartzia sp.]|nr:very short patch repair endonuclease [Schwartzia sp. (in: firmicutes)]